MSEDGKLIQVERKKNLSKEEIKAFYDSVIKDPNYYMLQVPYFLGLENPERYLQTESQRIQFKEQHSRKMIEQEKREKSKKKVIKKKD